MMRRRKEPDEASLQAESDEPPSPQNALKSPREIYKEWAREQPDRFRLPADFQVHEKPRQIIYGYAFCAVLLYLGFYARPPATQTGVLRYALGGVLASVVLYSFLQTRDGLLVRPHPAFWRCVHGVCLFHWFFVIALLLLTPDQGRELMYLIFPGTRPDPSRRKNVFDGTLEIDCRINLSTVIRQIQTPWFTSHIIGWFLKMLMYRDWKFCLVLSTMYELCELSFQWLIPEFQECWWDSILMDSIGANLIGMTLGVGLLRWMNAWEFDWVGQRPLYQRALLQFTPFSWSEYQWAFFKSPDRLLAALWLLAMSLLTELNVFFFMYSLELPASHFIHPLRCIYICLLALNAVPEHYEYMNTHGKRIGHNEWLLGGIITVECLVNVKYGASKWASIVPPLGVCVPWCVSLVLFLIWCTCHFATCERDVFEGIKQPLTQTHTQNSAQQNGACHQHSAAEKGCSSQQAGWHYGVARAVARVPPLLVFSPLVYLFKYYDYT
ncbi:unnamed protein product [Vitrella brassicaformis CCMP3155]|uniref:Phosphatidylserine synthase n=1 Tax=Vitrella brassicaformis (strain CCMP3155) TaxID=1169540 RepID=A0A0G4GZ11_VITBC|nr:unnamed protein product [Vitrella brassicaformis CCMP3155]|mmetsp:Transcript_6954/g.20151  ORF Transcript_6954/g.20151 Transcript_6954/m.20151 type:complete len:495 (-) Transcript_6954:607-2091(-)|eukprot:CEM36299.1 unnamed protein product [Vitrella brassicaformis CCMP3155]